MMKEWSENGIQGFARRAELLIPSVIFALAVLAATASNVEAQKAKPTPNQACAKNGLTEIEMTSIVDGHNTARTEVKAAKLAWDCTLADAAQSWADKSVSGHSDTDLGENIFVSATASINPSAAVVKWLAERDGWDNKAGKCRTGKTCTHYTQMMWNKTAKIGCGINRAATGKWKTILVCNYSPAGNMPGPAY